MKKIGQQINNYFISNKLPFDASIINFTCFIGSISTLITLLSRIISGMPLVSVLTMAFIYAFITIMFFIAIKGTKSPTIITTIALYVFGIVLWPAMFFTGGGPVSGMAAYFVLIIILDFLLPQKFVRIGAIVSTCAVTIFCYVSTLFFGLKAYPVDGLNTFQLFIDNIQAILVAGFFMGSVIIFQNKVYLQEKVKAESAGVEIMRSEDLLTLVNESATILLTSEPDKFAAALAESMEKIAKCLDIDGIFIWRLTEHNGEEVYNLLYNWISSTLQNTKTIGDLPVSKAMPRIPDWDNRMLGGRGYMSELSKNFGNFVGEKLQATGVQAIMAFPVYFQGRYWGFVSFENKHSERLCSEREAVILQSGSLLLANAVERNDNLLQLSERLTQQQLMSDISKNFISKEPLGDLIHSALARMGEFLGVERIIIAVLEKDSDMSRPEYVWFKDKRYTPNASQKGFNSIIREFFPKYFEGNDDSHNIYCNNTLKYANGKFKLFNEKGGVNSFIGIPLYVNDELWGIMSIEKHEGFRQWNGNDLQLVSLVSSAISNAVARDIVEKERAAALQQAIAASAAKGDFLSNMSHEIRTPMNAIIGMTSIGKSVNTIEKKDYAFSKIDNASKHLLGVINDILDMSKIEANKLELSLSSFDFESMIQRVVNFISFRVDERKQQFCVSLDSKIPQTLVGDDQRLSQVITNFLSNAVKFTPEEGAIKLSASLLSEENGMCRIQIEVSDNGIGISDEQKTRLFRSFEQAEAGTSRKYGGTGLGLAISKRIINLMGGEVWVESEMGKGSKFAFTVSLLRGSKEEKHLLKEGVDWKNIKIFAVDDEPYIREFFMETTSDLGVFCQVAESGEEALELLSQKNNFDIFFIDWKLPGINGVELARQIKSKIGQKFIVIIISSCDWSLIEDDARSVGIDKFLPKPLFRSTIVNLINEHIVDAETTKKVDVDENKDDFSRFTVLLAEDMEINREIIISLLEPTGIAVECAENGTQAVEMFKAAPEKYSLIFMDVQMPEMDGYEATQIIRALGTKKAASIPIVAMTANVFREDIERCIKFGMNAHVGKPINIDEVLSALRRFLIVDR